MTQGDRPSAVPGPRTSLAREHSGGTTEPVVPGAAASIWTLCGITLKRLGRGKALWIGGVFATLPAIHAIIVRALHVRAPPDQLFVLPMLLLAVLPAMFVSASVGDDLEDGTSTYLWSRPIARWVVLAGKLCALTPIVIVLIVGGSCVGIAIWTEAPPPAEAWTALAVGCIATSGVVAGIATLVPRHGMVLAIGYMLVDLFFSAIPLSLNQLSITYQTRTLAGMSRDSPAIAGPLLAMAVIAGLWVAIGLVRIRRIEV